ncbi:hypothetical protein AcV5_003773 [Taiwanofungus camphoratus]|nr:hypothetical protein AcV5_003773 [Antrodia cinnamomea]
MCTLERVKEFECSECKNHEDGGRLTGEGVPCPIVFEPEDLHKTKKLSAKLQVADENFEGCRGMVGFETETWVSNEHYAMAMALAELLKLRVLTKIPEEEVRAKTEANWFLNDMHERITCSESIEIFHGVVILFSDTIV